MKVIRSGFVWSDIEWRFLAFEGDHYGYGATPEAAEQACREAMAAKKEEAR